MKDDYYKLVGTVCVPEEKKEEFNEYVLELLRKTGMRRIREITLAGKTVKVVETPAPDPDGNVRFNYSIFEKKEREMAVYHTCTCELEVPDRGNAEFCLTINMIWAMQESYSEGSCYFMADDQPNKLYGTTLLVQSLLGIRLHFPGRRRIWDMALFFHDMPDYKMDPQAIYKDCPDEYDINDCFEYLAVMDLDETQIMEPDHPFRGSKDEIKMAGRYPLWYYSYEVFQEILRIDKKDELQGFLKELLDSDLEQRRNIALREDAYGLIAELSLYLPCPRIVKAYAVAVGQSFWDAWESLNSNGYSEIIRLPVEDIPEQEMKTISYYDIIQRENEDEFLEFWEDKELHLSDEMKKCMQSWKKDFSEIEDTDYTPTEMLLEELITELHDTWNCRYVDYEFVKEFMEHAADENYRKALLLWKKIIRSGCEYFPELTEKQAVQWLLKSMKDEFDLTEMSAFQSLLINHKHRLEILGF